MKFSVRILTAVAHNNLVDLQNKEFLKQKDDKGKDIKTLVRHGWIQRFMDRCNIVPRRQTGKLMISPIKQDQIKRAVDFNLGTVCRMFKNKDLDEECVENIDETHFIINYDDGKTLGFVGDEEVKYADVVSGGQGIEILVRIRGGNNACLEAPFLIFQNQGRNYPIRNVADDVPGVSYRTQPKGWLDQDVFLQWLHEPRAISKDIYGRTKTVFLDNCGGHNVKEDHKKQIENLKLSLKYLPPNSTNLCHPCDSFVIQKIKERWCQLQDLKKAQLLSSDEWVHGNNSGKLPNPGRRYFLQLASQVVRDVNNMEDINGVSHARKAMIRCGLALDLNGSCREEKLFPHLQKIIKQFRNHFNGEPVPELNN